MDKSNELNPSNSNESSLPSKDQIRNLLTVIADREEKLSELATQQQRLILWRVQYVRLEREWNDVRRVFLSPPLRPSPSFVQIKTMIHNFETKLASNLTLAVSLTDAEKFHRDHEDIKPFVDVRRREKNVRSVGFLLAENLRTDRSFATQSGEIEQFVGDERVDRVDEHVGLRATESSTAIRRSTSADQRSNHLLQIFGTSRNTSFAFDEQLFLRFRFRKCWTRWNASIARPKIFTRN